MTKLLRSIAVVILCTVALSACAPVGPQAGTGRDILYQTSTLNALMEGYYDGDTTIGDVTQRGDFGLGTFDGLDGEMVELDGQVYQIKTDGIAYIVADGAETPFAVVTFFEIDDTVELEGPVDCAEVESLINSRLPTVNIPYAIKMDGSFAYVKARSVPKQVEPYPPLVDVVAKQTIFEFSDVEGTIIGFRLPAYMAGANAAGYHLHFITSDRVAGGHVLECQVANVLVEIDYTDEWHVELPSSEAYYQMDLESVTIEGE